MDEEGFRKYLTDRDQPIPEEEIIENTKIVEKFEQFLKQFGKTLETATAEEFERFSEVLIVEEANTYLKFAAISRYICPAFSKLPSSSSHSPRPNLAAAVSDGLGEDFSSASV